MKKLFALILIIPLIMLIIPLYSLKNDSKPQVETVADLKIPVSKDIPYQNVKRIEKFRLLNHKTGEIQDIDSDEYLLGVLAAEMPVLFDDEALKAQTVAAYTFACYKKADSKNRKYDVSTDFNYDQAFIDEGQRKEKWGEKADEYTEKLKAIIKSVEGEIVTYKGNLALTVYHALSAGMTESAENVWGKAVPYLIPAECSDDKLDKNYMQTFEFKTEALKEKLKGICKLEGEPQNWIGDRKLTESGYVRSITICKKSLAGEKIRKALELPSCCFDIKFDSGIFTVNTYGNGHGVGMSQRGADSMAKRGNSYKEILKWFYPGCEIVKR